MSEAEARDFLTQLRDKNAAETNPARVLAWCGGISALEMVLGDRN